MRAFLILGGVAFLLLAVAGAVFLTTGHEMLKMWLVDGVPVFFEHGGSQTQFPGRLVGTVMIAIPIVAAVGGVWLIRSAFDKGEE